MKRRILVFLLALSTLLLSLVSCKKEQVDANFDEKAPVNIRVYTLNGTTGFGMAKLMEDAQNGAFQWENYSFEVMTDATLVRDALINGSVDIAAIPTNVASAVYNATNGRVKMLAVNTLGCLYLVNGGTSSNPLNINAALNGKTVYVPAQNPTYILQHLCKQNGLKIISDGTPKNGEVLIDSTSYAAPAALRDAVATGAVQLAVLPEPMVTIAKNKAKNSNPAIELKVELDLTAEWDKLDKHSNTLVQGCVVVRTEFLEKYPYAVANFLAAYEKSVNYLNENTEDAAKLIKKHGIFDNEAVAIEAIPKCNVKFVSGAQMRTTTTFYLTQIAVVDDNAKAIGGKVPTEDFYYHATR